MEDAYNIAAAKSGQSMEKGREHYNERTFATGLELGDRVLVNRTGRTWKITVILGRRCLCCGQKTRSPKRCL